MSNSLLFQMLLKMDAGQAKAELQAFTAATNKVGAEVAALPAKTRPATDGVQKLGQAHQNAAGSVGNLVAQFNDIGMMIAAGQNPLQLAIQQGSQISQVIGPMGAAGAFKALGGALLGMLNPINLVTFGVIAGGAALAQWAMSGEEAVTSIADRVKDIEAAVTEVSDKIATIKFDEQNIGVARAVEELQLLEIQLVRINARRNEVTNERARYTLGYEADALQAEYDSLEKVVQAYRDAVAEKKRLEDRSTADQMLADLQAEAELNAVIAEYGARSAEAIAMRTEQERAAYVEQVKSLEVSEAMKLSLIVAFDNAQALAGVDFASGIGAGADAAARLGKNLAEAANAWLAARSIEQQPGNLAMAKYGSRGTISNRPIEDGSGEVIKFRAASTSSGTRGAGGGGAAQVDSVAKMVEKLQAELDVSRELDPVQREMAKYREQMARATDGERQQVEALIAQRLREKEVTESLGYIGQQSGNALIDGLMGAADAGEQLVQTLMRAALQAALLGEGPLAGLFGGGGGLLGTLVGVIGGGGIMGRADGGMIYGAGGPRDDAIPFWGSAGEFVVNARATARNRSLLERINSGQMPSVPAFAAGGAVGGGTAVGGAFGGMVLNAHFDLRGAQGDDAVEAAARRGMEQALKEFARTEMAGHVRRMTADPSVVRF